MGTGGQYKLLNQYGRKQITLKRVGNPRYSRRLYVVLDGSSDQNMFFVEIKSCILNLVAPRACVVNRFLHNIIEFYFNVKLLFIVTSRRNTDSKNMLVLCTPNIHLEYIFCHIIHKKQINYMTFIQLF